MPVTLRSQGFTLVEVLVATVVVAVGLLAALTAFSVAARVSGVSTSDTLVAFLAQEKLAEVRLAGWQGLSPGIWTGDFEPGFPGYSWELTVRAGDDRHVVPVDLVIYASETGREREIRFSTLVF